MWNLFNEIILGMLLSIFDADNYYFLSASKIDIPKPTKVSINDTARTLLQKL